MSGASAAAVPGWLRIVVWSVAIGIAAVGAVLAIVSSSLWPLIAYAGLGLPILPVGTPRTARRARSGAASPAARG